MSDIGVTTALTLSAVAAANYYLTQDTAFTTGVVNPGRTAVPRAEGLVQRPALSLREAVGTTGTIAYGVGFGAMVAGLQTLRARSRRVVRKAEADESAGLAVKEAEKKEAVSGVPYFKDLPRTIVDKETLDRALDQVDPSEWENPPEDSYLYTLKSLSETYGEGKATKMGWFDYYTHKINALYKDDMMPGTSQQKEEAWKKQTREYFSGKVPVRLPVSFSAVPTGINIDWRGGDPWSGESRGTPVFTSGASKKIISNMAWYREGLKPWQRGIEIGMAHGYFIIGPFVALGPLRNTPEAATAGLLAGVALIGIASSGGMLTGTLEKPTVFDKPGDSKGHGFREFMSWHAFGGVGGAGFAHALLTVFGLYTHS